MPLTALDLLLRKRVVVRANGITYRGILLEATQTEITLRGETGFVTIPMERVTAVRDAAAKNPATPEKSIDPSFYSADDEPKPPSE